MAARKKGSRTLDTTFPEPDLLPFLNVIFMLILAMVSMAAMLPLGVVPTAAQTLSSGLGTQVTKPDKKPLNLTLFVTDNGFNLSLRGVVKTSDKADPLDSKKKLPLIPMIETAAGKEYDFAALAAKLEEIKKQDPDETQLIITADQEVIFDALIKAMDAVRLDSNNKPLFPSISFAAGIVG